MDEKRYLRTIKRLRDEVLIYKVSTVTFIILFFISTIVYTVISGNTHSRYEKILNNNFDTIDSLKESYYSCKERNDRLGEQNLSLSEFTTQLQTENNILCERNKKLLNEVNFYSDYNVEFVGEYMCTAYCVEEYEHICGTGNGITASGKPIQSDVTVAMKDFENFPYGTILYIEGIGFRIVQDTGGAIDKYQIDIAVDSHEEAINFGVQSHKVYIIGVIDSEG